MIKHPHILKELLEYGDSDIVVKAYPIVSITGVFGYFAFYFVGKSLGTYENIYIRIFVASLFFILFFIKNTTVFQKNLTEIILAICLPLFYSYFFFSAGEHINWGIGTVFGGFTYGFLTGKIFNTVTIYPLSVLIGFFIYCLVFNNNSMACFFSGSEPLITSTIAAAFSSLLKLIFNYHLLVAIHVHKKQTEHTEKSKFHLCIEQTGQLEKKLSLMRRLETVAKLTNTISGDFTNMLSIISLQASIAGKKIKIDSNRQKQINTILETVEKSSKLLNNLSQFSQSYSTVNEPIDIHDILEKTLQSIDKDTLNNIRIIKNFFADETIVYGNDVLLQNVFLNLIINALQAMPDGGTLALLTSVKSSRSSYDFFSNHTISIEITDTGCGIDETIIDKIFEPFFTTKESGKGSGIGLSMVYGTVRQYEGSISVKSKKGLGSTFIVELPLTSNSSIPSVHQSLPKVSSFSNIFLFESNSDLCQAMTTILELNNFSVISISKHLDLFDRLSFCSRTIDLIILDISKFDIDKTINTLKDLKINHAIPVVLTGVSFNDEWENIDKNRAILFLRKPVTESSLLNIISSVKVNSGNILN